MRRTSIILTEADQTVPKPIANDDMVVEGRAGIFPVPEPQHWTNWVTAFSAQFRGPFATAICVKVPEGIVPMLPASPQQ